MIKPLIKYAGGKFKEYDKFCDVIPTNINNYYEPFFGGGGVCFRLYNEKKINGDIYINDFSSDLINFYKTICEDELKQELYLLNDAWSKVKVFGSYIYEKYKEQFNEAINGNTDIFLTNDLMNDIANFNVKYNFHGLNIQDFIIKELKNKIKRFSNKKLLENKNTAQIALTTCICQAFYFAIRKMYNDWNNHGNKDEYTIFEKSAHWFFIREFCFCSMFRFGKNGDFNVPYGGFGYNNKDFKIKIDNVISEETKVLFSKINISNDDFENALKNVDFKENDFIFLDPPYDSTFKEYDNSSFTKEDQKRLKNILSKINCKWMIVIGKTDFILDLYKDYNIIEYDKTYMYQARGTYDNKKTTHLVITNY